MTITAMTTRVLRLEVSVDDLVHLIPEGPVLHVAPWRLATRRPAGRVEVWVEARLPTRWPDVPEAGIPRRVQVFGTGHPIPDGATWRGTCLDGQLVWHLYDLGPAVGGDQ